MLKPLSDNPNSDALRSHVWIISSSDKVLIHKHTNQLPNLASDDFQHIEAYHEDIRQLCDLAGKTLPYLVLDLGAEHIAFEQCEFVSLRHVMMHAEQGAFDVIGRAWQLLHFYRTHRFCGRCGTPTKFIEWETAAHCDRCGHRSYPRISPCVIIAIYRKGEILLANNVRHKDSGMYSTIAGFVESGEQLEEAVHREILEEVGVRVKNIEYFGSQPWPFPHALMVGYIAEWESGDIKIDDHEIADAKWFSVDALPLVPPDFSIAGRLIEKVINMQQEQKID